MRDIDSTCEHIIVEHIADMAMWLASFVDHYAFNADKIPEMPGLSYVEIGLPIQICADLKVKHTAIEKIVKAAQSAKTLSNHDFHDLEAGFQKYMQALLEAEKERKKLYEQELELLNSGQLASELKREMSRLERNNTTFCLANVCIDQRDISSDLEVQRILNKKIQHLLRDFDDSYNLGDTETVLCLKDIDLLDAKNILLRLCKEVSETDFGQHYITVSAGVCEPVSGDKIENLLAGIKREREEARQSGGNTVFDYIEKSPLARLTESDIPK